MYGVGVSELLIDYLLCGPCSLRNKDNGYGTIIKFDVGIYMYLVYVVVYVVYMLISSYLSLLCEALVT